MPEMDCSRHMKDIGEAMPFRLGVFRAQFFGQSVDIRPVDRHDLQHAADKVGLEIAQHRLAFVFGEPFGLLVRVQPDLEANRLAKLKKHKRGDRQWPGQARHECIRLGRVALRPIECAEEGSVREMGHPSSPSSSAARIAFTSSSLKTRSPQIARRLAAKSGSLLRFPR